MNLLKLPESTAFGKVIPKNSFDSYTSTNQKKSISDSIKRITWTHKLSEETTNLKSNSVEEIQLLLIELKVKAELMHILRIIDRAIPYHIIFILKSESDLKFVTSAKHNHQTKVNESIIDCVFESAWTSITESNFQVILKGSLDSVFINFCNQLTGRNNKSRSYEDFISREIKIKSIESLISIIKRKLKNEKQFNNKVSLNMKLNKLKQELTLITN